MADICLGTSVWARYLEKSMKSVKAKGVELAAHLQQSELLYSSFASTILPHILLTCDIMGVEVALSGRVENQVVDGVADLRWQTEET